ncbi:MAG TPA: prolyl oligopeptidase family serine peptidase [Vicinamibacterales bacterium]
MSRPLLVALVLGSVTTMSASAPRFELSVDSIMRGPKVVGYPPSDLRWSGDSERLYFEWRGREDDETSTWVVSRSCLADPASGCAPRRLNDEERKQAPPPDGMPDRARRRVLGVQDGDIVLIDTVAGTRTALTRTSVPEDNPRWARDETHVTFTRENRLYLLPLGDAGDGLQQLTDAGPPKREPELTESQKFLKEEEARLLEYVRETEERRKKREARKEREALPKLELSDRQSAVDLQLAHGDRFVYALVVERAAQAKRADVPAYVTASGYTEQLPARTKVGDAQDTRWLAILDLQTKKQVWATLEQAEGGSDPVTTTEPRGGPHEGQAAQSSRTSSTSTTTDAAKREDEKSGKTAKRDPAKELRWTMPIVSRDGNEAVALVMSADNENRWFVRLDPHTGKARVLDHLRDEAWVRLAGFGPGGRGGAGFLPDGRRFWFLSERDGWMHLYVVDVTDESAQPRQLTSGKWEIVAAELSPDERHFLITSTEQHPGERHVYALPIDGGERRRLTTLTGSNTIEVSPDGRMYGLLYSSANRSPEVHLVPASGDAAPVRVTQSPTDEWLSYKWVEPQLVTYKARDGAEVYARLYTPEMVGAKRHPSRPAVVFVHGAGYLQNAHKYWSSYYREYMFHHLLASRGYVVLDPDYRASAGYGREWRTAIYRHMGGKDLEDVVDGAAWLVKTQRVHPDRIGVYGGSYGGFITLMAMFTTPDVFAAGAALRPVTDWAHYNHGYTSNILNEPQTDPEAYRRSSPIHFAQNLKGALLICHGMMDVNVHVQDSIRLAQRLIELRKENWELALYPVEDHAFEQETSWADEYKRILKLFETTLKR